jgi:hypothetical protein
VTVNIVNDLPAVCIEAFGRVVREPTVDLTVDGDIVVIVKANELTELQRAGKRAGLVGDTFHQAAVAEENPGLVINDIVTRTVEFGGEHLLSHGHTDRVGDALPQRARGCLNRTIGLELRMAGRPVTQLPEVPQLID